MNPPDIDRVMAALREAEDVAKSAGAPEFSPKINHELAYMVNGETHELFGLTVGTLIRLADRTPEPSADTQRDAARYRALRPFLSVGECENGGEWGLWCVNPLDKVEGHRALHWREPDPGAEDARCEAGDPHWGPGIDAMVDEMIAAARTTPTVSGGPGADD